jgi:hypothetical protein
MNARPPWCLSIPRNFRRSVAHGVARLRRRGSDREETLPILTACASLTPPVLSELRSDQSRVQHAKCHMLLACEAKQLHHRRKVCRGGLRQRGKQAWLP